MVESVVHVAAATALVGLARVVRVAFSAIPPVARHTSTKERLTECVQVIVKSIEADDEDRQPKTIGASTASPQPL